MSDLVVDELFDGVTFNQTFRIKRNTNLKHIRPWIYLHGTLADGDFQLEILKGATVLVTKQINFVDINAVKTETFAHGFIRFDFDSLALNVGEGNTTEEYILRFTMQNYSDDPNNFLGIVRNWEFKINDIYGPGVSGNQAPNDQVEPAGFETYEVRNR